MDEKRKSGKELLTLAESNAPLNDLTSEEMRETIELVKAKAWQDAAYVYFAKVEASRLEYEKQVKDFQNEIRNRLDKLEAEGILSNLKSELYTSEGDKDE